MARPLCVWCRKREEDVVYRPFCSDRCRLADLGQWLSGAYRVESALTTEADAEEVSDASDDDREP